MRGKLRDKRAATKRDSFKRDIIERRRPSKRDNRSLLLLNQQEDDLDLEIEDDNEAPRIDPGQKK